MRRTAVFSPCRRFRYRLGRRWSEGPTVCFVLLNPSTANEITDDPTIRRCLDFGRRHGYGGLEIVNLFAYGATDPADLRRAGYPVDRDNDEHLLEAAQACDAVVLAWGAHGARQRAQEVLRTLRPRDRALLPEGHRERAPRASLAAAGGVRAAGVRSVSGKVGNPRGAEQ